ncbi:sn-glycerol-3-phosphate ABC transporter ATP-binding protein UgpC [Clostridium sp. MB40-C1]|uniref:ABC transporter ATP-binding protein n=1 Tax=Clostridium sp. MB40-C1 TaxID=3070996 RepID=UPI0027E1E8C1|nr:sn-glycerol-3-phosphate ABC transporter ATP-binding protein UgpC [Clostridium sp. MB40-C1]WMJ80821.1 sn-glycerol-3-phosphate ABC transporter ATP-binding protein UgpC [Clostridium sp. MB40-C1]
MAGLILKNIEKVYPNGFHAVHNFTLTIEDKEFIVFVGPSGCGKSTTLRMIAGLEEVSSGELYIGENLVNDVAPKDRDIAMVFQNYALYPHMTVYDNMAFGLKLRKMSKDEIKKKVTEAAKILGIEDLLDRKPKQLSGGQKQRVALGRSIVRNPKVFLMDEPLSNLDAKLRVQMRAEISKLHQQLKTTFIYVTHDQTEAMTMGTRIVVMKDGIIQQVADPQSIYKHPNNVFVASFIGSPQMNFIECTIKDDKDNLYAEFNGNIVRFSDKHSKLLKDLEYVNKEVILGIRPENIFVHYEISENKENVIETMVQVKEMLGSETYLHLEMHNQSLIARVDPNTEAEIGKSINIGFKIDKIHIFNKGSEEAMF